MKSTGPKIDKDLMLQMYHDGKTFIEIADYFGTKSGKNIEALIKKLEKIPIDRQKVFALHKTDWSDKDIAKELNVSVEDIKEILKNAR